MRSPASNRECLEPHRTRKFVKPEMITFESKFKEKEKK